MEETQSTQPFEKGNNGNGKGLSTAAKIGIGVGILIGLLVLGVVLYYLLDNPSTTETIRDLFIIVLALESLIIGLLLVILIYQLVVLIRMLRDDLKPMIESTQETLNTVKGTATFVSQRMTKPAIAASSYVTGIGRSIGVLIQMLPRRRSTPANASIGETTPESRELEEGA